MALVSAIVQEGWRGVLARLYSLDTAQAFAEPFRFKVGEGGFIDIPPKEPVSPDATREDLFSEGDATSGTAVFTNSSAAIVGTGTSFLSQVTPGMWVKPGPTSVAEGLTAHSAGDIGSEYDEWGLVLNVPSDTSITLTAPYAGATSAGARALHKADAPLFTFRKLFSPADVLFSSDLPAITEFTMILLAAEANANQLLASPELFELGIFDANNVMMVHMTFPLESKTASIQLNHVVELIF